MAVNLIEFPDILDRTLGVRPPLRTNGLQGCGAVARGAPPFRTK